MSDLRNEKNATGYYRIINNKMTAIRCFKYNTNKIWGATTDNNTLDAEIVVPLKYFNNL